jgi:hypothetical protein
MQMALGRLVTLYRDMQEGRQHADPLQELKTLPQYQKLTKTLRELDFEWDLRCVNTRSNQYRLELKKANQALAVTQTSSGERELLNFVFGMFGLASEGCLLLIDEPELHLHPRWQRILLKLFQDFVSSTETQIIAATHSPSFITPESLGSIFRVFQQAGTSRVHRMHAASDLPRKSILALVNSHNNEKLFFADLVVLVEGISDRVVFEWLLRKADLSGRIVEVIEVHGKDNFTTYMRLLSAAQIPFAIVADRDYLARVGSDEIKVLFAPRSGKVASSLQHPDYGDAQVFIDTLDDAVKTGDLESLKNILGYVKLRHSRLLPNVATEQQQMLEAFIEERGKEHVYILKRGALEAYLIDQLRSKQLETLIHALATATKRSDVLDHEGEAEIEAIVQEIAILARNERG